MVSPNGLDLAYVDGRGNIALGRLDGTGVRILTATDPEVRRAQPTFEDGGSEVVFSERGRDGVWRLKEVASDGHDDLTAGKPDPTVAETQQDHGGDTAPSATWFQASHSDTAAACCSSSTAPLEVRSRSTSPIATNAASARRRCSPGARPRSPRLATGLPPSSGVARRIGGAVAADRQPQAAPDPGHLGSPPHRAPGLVARRSSAGVLHATRRGVGGEHPDATRSQSTHRGPPAPRRRQHRNARAACHPGTFAGDPVTTALDVSEARFVDGVDQPMGGRTASGCRCDARGPGQRE